MFGLGATELILILLIILLLFGARKLPEIGSSLGKAIRSFKKATSEETEKPESSVEKETTEGDKERKP